MDKVECVLKYGPNSRIITAANLQDLSRCQMEEFPSIARSSTIVFQFLHPRMECLVDVTDKTVLVEGMQITVISTKTPRTFLLGAIKMSYLNAFKIIPLGLLSFLYS